MQGPRFTRRQEDFECLNCGELVRGRGYTNHCPLCLWSRHVDVFPGDRAATCLGPMRPVGALFESSETVIVQRCDICGHTRRNRAAPDDDHRSVMALFGRVIEENPPRRTARRRGRNR